MSPGIDDDNRIATVDFAAFLDGSDKQAVADKILASFKDIGFVYLLNHGIPPEWIARMFSLSKEFFAQPTEVKMLAPHPPSGTHHRGYSSPGQEKVIQHVYDSDAIAEQRAQAPDVKESFECGREGDEVMPNIWLPEGVLPGFKETCLEFFWLCYKIELNILRALALGLQLPEEYFVKYHTAPDNQLRLLHYPSVPTEALESEKIARIGQHSDFGSITLLLQDNVGGLEVEDPYVAGNFRPAPRGPTNCDIVRLRLTSCTALTCDTVVRWSIVATLSAARINTSHHKLMDTSKLGTRRSSVSTLRGGLGSVKFG